MNNSASFRTYDWSEWSDFMKCRHDIHVPEEIILKEEGGGEITKRTEEASLDEVSSAAVYLREKIRLLNNILDGIYAIEERTRQGSNSGATKISEALGLASAVDVDAYLECRKEEGKRIVPETAEANRFNVRTLDPYGLDKNLPYVYQQISREIFVRNQDSEIWVWIGDVPAEIRRALNARPGGLFGGIEDEIPF